jgi:sulfofructosephosphate aldolase
MPAAPPARLLQRASGGFAMLAIDQRESMRAMLAARQSEPVTDAQIADFKIAAIRALTPYASGVLLDRPFAWRRAIDERAVAPGCGLIAAADAFVSSADEIVAAVSIDEAVVPEQVRADGAVAMKLLVTWRPDEEPETRIGLVDAFVARCRRAGLMSIIEPVSRKPRDGRAWDLNDGILAAAKELGRRGADLYKAEVPLHGKGAEADVRLQCSELTGAIAGPWVVLSSGVPPDAFPRAVEWACREGASGFLAGRAVWSEAIGRPDIEAAFRDDSAPRLLRLCEVVDRWVAT